VNTDDAVWESITCVNIIGWFLDGDWYWIDEVTEATAEGYMGA
jgi:hypothetical protein